MKRFIAAITLALFASVAIAIDSESFEDPVLHARYRKLTQELRCPKCQNENIRDSNAEISVDLRRELRTMLLDGKTDEEIIRFLTARYGDFILYRPPFASRTILLWIAPGLALLGGLAAVVVVVRRRATKSFDDTPDHTSSNEAAGADSQ